MKRFKAVVSGILFSIFVALGLVHLFPEAPTLLYHGSDPTMPSALSVGEFGFNGGGDDPDSSSSSMTVSGTGCLFLKKELCEHPVSFDNTNLWQQGSSEKQALHC